MCRVTLRDRVNTDTLYDRMGVDRITGGVTRGRLRWFDHVERKPDSDGTKGCIQLEVKGVRGSGRDQKTGGQCVGGDLKRWKRETKDATVKKLWQRLVRSSDHAQRTLNGDDDDDDDDDDDNISHKQANLMSVRTGALSFIKNYRRKNR